jgi:hypothetical protein
MRARSAVPLVVLLGALLCLQPPPLRAAATATPQLELGYGLSTLSAISSGVPVYTYGDSMWVMMTSQGSYSVQLVNPGGAVVVGATLEPDAPLLLHVFASDDLPGTWTLSVQGSGPLQGSQDVPVLLSEVPPVQFNMTGGTISSSGVYTMDFGTVNAPDAYDFSACAFGVSLPQTVLVPIPSSLGHGSMEVELNNGTIIEGPEPLVSTITTPFDFWVELYQNYSYTIGGTSTLVSKQVQVAASSAIPISSQTTSAKVAIMSMTAFRPGLFSLRVFFDTSQFFFATQASVLLTENGEWTPFQGCGNTSVPATNVFTVSSTLGDNTSLWPSQVFLTYQENGVEGFSVSSLVFKPAAVELLAAPWDATFNDSELSILPSSSVLSYAFVDNILFVAASHYPVDVNFTLLNYQAPQQVVVPIPYTLVKAPIGSDELVVTTSVAGDGAAALTNLTVSEAGEGVAQGLTNSSGIAVFYLPAGNYSVTGDYENSTETARFLASANQLSQLALTFPAPPSLLSSILLATGVVGIAATIAIWIAFYRGRRASLKY